MGVPGSDRMVGWGWSREHVGTREQSINNEGRGRVTEVSHAQSDLFILSCSMCTYTCVCVCREQPEQEEFAAREEDQENRQPTYNPRRHDHPTFREVSSIMCLSVRICLSFLVLYVPPIVSAYP